MFYPHTRSLGAQSGVQLDQVIDNTDSITAGNGDQMGATVGRFKRGRIDAPFVVDRGTLKSKLGTPESLRVSALNEAYVHLYEALNNGAVQAVVSRLSTSAAVNSYAVFNIDESGVSSFTVSPTAPTTKYLFYLKDLECFNDGIQLSVSAAQVLDGVTPKPTAIINLIVMEADGTIRYNVTGSLDEAAVDDYGQDYFIGSKIAALTDTIEISTFAGATIPVNADCYGRASDGSTKAATTGDSPLVLFAEGGTSYTADDYDRAVSALETGTIDYRYGFSGGSEAVALVSKLVQMHIRANRTFVLDVPGDLTPEAAATWIAQLGIDTHYVSYYWAPLQTDDPVNGGKAIIGLGGYQVGLRCGRNASTNSYGLAPMNYPIAGKDWPLNRTGVKQLVTPTDNQLNDLAAAKINPVVFERYNGGSKYVFRDSLTAAQVSTSYRKLISVAEMSSTLDDMVVKYGKECLQLPMDVAITRMEKYLKTNLAAMRSSGWIVASNNPALGDTGYAYTVTANAQRPADKMDVKYWIHYNGVNRAAEVQQSIEQ